MSNRKILVTGPNLDPSAVKLAQDHGFETIHTPAYADSAVIAEMLIKSGAEGIVSRMGRIDASVMDAAPQLRVISKHGVGVDNIDLDAATARGITVLMATGANAVSVAEHAIALMLASVKRVVPLDAALHEGRWEKPGFLGRELAGSRLGLLGMGAIAQATGRIAKGLGLELYGYDPFVKPAAFEDLGVTRCDSLPEFFARCDVLSLHCPLTTETRGIVNAEAIAQMPKGAFIINTARGGLIDEAALVAAIRSGHLGGAGLDTFAVEPPAPDHPFFAEASIVLTPHIGGVTREAGARVGVDAVRGILQVLAGEAVDLERIANRAVLAKAAQPHVKAGE